MAAPLVKVKNNPGIYKRGSRYVVAVTVNGKQTRPTFRTFDEARRAKRAIEADRDRGEYAAQSRVKFREYAEEWVERHTGRGSRGFREDTRDDYRRDLERYAYPKLGAKRLTEYTAREISNWLAWVSEQNGEGRKTKLSDASVKRIFAPVRSCFATALAEGLIRFNPCDGAQMPYTEPESVEDRAEKVKVLTRVQLADFLRVMHPEWRLFFEFLVATGLRWSEATALQWKHFDLDGAQPTVKVRRRYRKGSYGPPKSKYSVREVPIPWAMADALKADRGEAEQLVFATALGTPLDHSNTYRRRLLPAAEEADVAWAGFHTFRHTCASLLFAQGRNVKQVQRWMGHHSAAFTLDTYGHLLDEGVGEALDVAVEVGGASGGRSDLDEPAVLELLAV